MRIDRLPMDRQAQAAGSGEALFEVREVDPENPLVVARRPGSVRVASYAPSPAVRFDNGDSYAFKVDDVDTSSGWSALFTLTVDALNTTSAVKVFQFGASETGTSTTDSVVVTLTKTSSTTFTATATWTGTTGTPVTISHTSLSFGLGLRVFVGSSNSNVDGKFAVEYEDGTGYVNSSSTLGGLTWTSEDWYVLFGGPIDLTKSDAVIMTNLALYDQSVSPTIVGDRDPSGADWYWSLRDPYRVMASEGTATGALFLYPSAPAIVDGLTHFGGRSGAIRVDTDFETERFFASSTQAVVAPDFTVYLKGTMGTRASSPTKVHTLFEYGELLKVYVSAENLFIASNGTALNAVPLTYGTAFEIFAGREGSTVSITLNGTTYTTSSAEAPFLDLSDVPEILIGANAAQDEYFIGTLETAAMFDSATKTDLGRRRALFYLDLTTEIKDTSAQSRGVAALPHSADSGNPHFTSGPIQDAAYRDCVAGLVLSDTGPVGGAWDSEMNRRVEGDVTGLRLGSRVLAFSQDKGHIFNERTSTGRPFGLEELPGGVSTTAFGTGVLDGAYGYGIRPISVDGTYGPVTRLDPVAATGGSRVVVGTSSASTATSELGETYGDIPDDGTASAFRLSGRALGAGTYVEELNLALPDHDPDDIEERTHHRGAYGNGASATSFIDTPAPTNVNLNGDFTIQADFRYDQRAALPTYGLVSTIICSIGAKTNDSGGTNTTRNADFFAAIIDGRGNSNVASDEYDSDYPLNSGGGHYGHDAARLVVGISRRARHHRISGNGDLPGDNYFLLTFSDDSWTDGSDYSVIFKREGDALRVLVKDLTAGGTYTEISARTMSASGLATSYQAGAQGAVVDGYRRSWFSGTKLRSSNYTGSNFFADWTSLSWPMYATFGRGNGGDIYIPFISDEVATLGQPEHGNHKYISSTVTTTYAAEGRDGILNGFNSAAVFYHFRAWNRAVPDADLAAKSLYRFEGRDDGDLSPGIVHDLACVIEDEYEKVREFWDPAAGYNWRSRKDTNTLLKLEHFAQDDTDLDADRQFLYYLNDSAGTNYAVALYWTQIGNGSIILDVRGEGQYRLMTEAANPPAVGNSQNMRTLANSPGVATFDQFQWYSFSLKKIAGNVVQVLNMAIEGTPMFTQNIGGTSIATGASPRTDVGGEGSTAGTMGVHIAEWREWDDTDGPDPETGEGFDYLAGRVSEAVFNDLLVYVKFQPGDETGATDLAQYGSHSGDITYQNNADVADGRLISGAIAIPGGLPSHIANIQLLRTIGVTITDPQDGDEVQMALDEARNGALYSLALIPRNQSHYVDNIPDAGLGEEVDARTGRVPEVIKGAFSWQGVVGLVGADTTLHFAEPGPFGYESYPPFYDFRVPGSGGALTGGVSVGNAAYAFGKSWAVALTGSPGNPESDLMSGGVGADSQRALATWGNRVFAFNGHLWAIEGSQAADLGAPVRDLLPQSGSARLVVSSLLRSLYVIDLDNGDTLRYHIPTGRWTVEDRDVLSLGDLADGSATAFISQQGTYSTSSTSVYGDDVVTDIAETGTLSSDTVTLDSAITYPGLVRVLVVDANGVTAAPVPTEASGSTSTLTFGAGSLSALTDGAVTVYVGAPAEGMLIDSGWLYKTQNGTLRDVIYTIDSGTTWELGTLGQSTAGSRTSRSGVDYASVSTSGERYGGGLGDRYVRVLARAVKPEASELGHLQLNERPGG